MDNFKIIYRILKYLEASLDCEEFDPDALNWKSLRKELLNMMMFIG